jgi:hypothetical protein
VKILVVQTKPNFSKKTQNTLILCHCPFLPVIFSKISKDTFKLYLIWAYKNYWTNIKLIAQRNKFKIVLETYYYGGRKERQLLVNNAQF